MIAPGYPNGSVSACQLAIMDQGNLAPRVLIGELVGRALTFNVCKTLDLWRSPSVLCR